MFNRKDPLIDSVKNIMKENEIRRDAERQLNEELGIASKKALPFEHHANYDALLEQKIAEALHPNQQKLDVHEPEKDKLTAQDFKMLRAKKKPMKEEDDKSVQGSGAVTKDGKDVVSSTAPKAEGPTDKERAALTNKVKEIMKEYVELDESVVVSTTHHKDADGNKTWSVSHKKKKIGSITVDKTGSWSYEHEPSGNYEDGYESKKEAVKELKDTHKYHQKLIKSGEIPDNLKEASYSAKEARAGKDIGKPGKNFEKIAKSAAKRYGSKERGEKVAGAILAKLRSKNMEENVEQIDEVSRKTLHSYVNKAIDKVKSGEEPEGKRAKGLRKATTKLYKVDEETIEEKAPPGAKYERMVKHIKDKYSKGGLTDVERAKAYGAAWKAKNKEEMKEEVLAELRKNLGEDQLNEFLEKLGFAMGSKSSEPMKDVSGDIAGGGNVGGKGAPETSAPKAAPAPKPASEPLKDLSGGADIAGGGNVGGQGAPEKTAPKPAAPKPDISAAVQKSIEADNPGTPAPPSKPAAAAPKPAAPSAPKPAAPRAAAPKPAAPAPAAPAKPSYDGENESPLGALRQYQASKEAGAFDKPEASAPAAKPAARPAAPRAAAPAAPKPSTPSASMASQSGRENVLGPNDRGTSSARPTTPTPPTGRPTPNINIKSAQGTYSQLKESLETTIRKMLKD